MDYRLILATGFLLLCGAIFMQSLQSAAAFPQGTNISSGGNPVFSMGSSISNSTDMLVTAPPDQMMVITDMLLSMREASCASRITLITSSGETIAAVDLYSNEINASGSYHNVRAAYSPAVPIQHSFNSGLPLPAGETLSIVESGGCNIAYTLAGYYAHP